MSEPVIVPYTVLRQYDEIARLSGYAGAYAEGNKIYFVSKTGEIHYYTTWNPENRPFTPSSPENQLLFDVDIKRTDNGFTVSGVPLSVVYNLQHKLQLEGARNIRFEKTPEGYVISYTPPETQTQGDYVTQVGNKGFVHGDVETALPDWKQMGYIQTKMREQSLHQDGATKTITVYPNPNAVRHEQQVLRSTFGIDFLKEKPKTRIIRPTPGAVTHEQQILQSTAGKETLLEQGVLLQRQASEQLWKNAYLLQARAWASSSWKQFKDIKHPEELLPISDVILRKAMAKDSFVLGLAASGLSYLEALNPGNIVAPIGKMIYDLRDSGKRSEMFSSMTRFLSSKAGIGFTTGMILFPMETWAISRLPSMSLRSVTLTRLANVGKATDELWGVRSVEEMARESAWEAARKQALYEDVITGIKMKYDDEVVRSYIENVYGAQGYYTASAGYARGGSQQLVLLKVAGKQQQSLEELGLLNEVSLARQKMLSQILEPEPPMVRFSKTLYYPEIIEKTGVLFPPRPMLLEQQKKMLAPRIKTTLLTETITKKQTIPIPLISQLDVSQGAKNILRPKLGQVMLEEVRTRTFSLTKSLSIQLPKIEFKLNQFVVPQQQPKTKTTSMLKPLKLLNEEPRTKTMNTQRPKLETEEQSLQRQLSRIFSIQKQQSRTVTRTLVKIPPIQVQANPKLLRVTKKKTENSRQRRKRTTVSTPSRKHLTQMLLPRKPQKVFRGERLNPFNPDILGFSRTRRGGKR